MLSLTVAVRHIFLSIWWPTGVKLCVMVISNEGRDPLVGMMLLRTPGDAWKPALSENVLKCG